MKKQILIYIAVALILSATTSCKKENDPQAVASLTIVNALPEANQVVTDFKKENSFDKTGAGMFVTYGVFTPNNQLTIPNKEMPVIFYKYTNGKINPTPIYETKVSPQAGDASTLFLFGTLAQPESLLITKMPPYHKVTDSVMGLRFVNVSADKKPLKIRIVGNGIDQTVNDLVYKTATAYLSVKATTTVTDVVIECYDASSGVLLTSYTLADVGANLPQIPNKWRYKNYTLVLSKDTQGNFTNNPFLVYDF